MTSKLRRLIAAALIAFAWLAWAGAGGASGSASQPVGRITALAVSGGRVQFLFSADGLPPTATLNAREVRVTAAGQRLSVTAEPPNKAWSAQGAQGGAPKRAVMVILDTSGSMGAEDLRAARLGARGYAARLPGDVAVGLATTSTTASTRLLLAPTPRRDAFTTALQAVRPGGSTALYDALTTSIAQLTRLSSNDDRRIVVLSDGRDSASGTTLAAISAKLAGERIPVDAVAFRTQATSKATLRHLTRVSRGRLLESADARRMIGVFSGAAGTFSQAMWITAVLPRTLTGPQQLVVRATTSVGPASATTPISLPAPQPKRAPVAPTTPVSNGSPSPAGGVPLFVVLVLCFLALAVIAFALLSARQAAAGPEWAKQIDNYRARDELDGVAGKTALTRFALSLSRRLIRSQGLETRIAADLDRAGMSLRAHEWALLRGAAGLVAVLMFSLPAKNPIFGVIAGAGLAWAGSRIYLKSRITRRLATFSEQLPDALQMVAGSLRSGFSVSQALDRLAQQDQQPLGDEMARALAQTRIGVSAEDALDSVAVRMENDDLRWVVMAIRVQREVGGNLADVIDTTIETMRERTHLRRHIRALSAEGRLSGYVLIALPFLIAGGLFFTRPDYMRPLYDRPAGIAMLALALTLMTVGWLWMSRLVKTET